jgi:hypothetical protein
MTFERHTSSLSGMPASIQYEFRLARLVPYIKHLLPLGSVRHEFSPDATRFDIDFNQYK